MACPTYFRDRARIGKREIGPTTVLQMSPCPAATATNQLGLAQFPWLERSPRYPGDAPSSGWGRILCLPRIVGHAVDGRLALEEDAHPAELLVAAFEQPFAGLSCDLTKR